jgi:hypothetical protein
MLGSDTDIGVTLFYQWAHHDGTFDEETQKRAVKVTGQRLISVEQLKAQGWVETGTIHPLYGSVLLVKAEVESVKVGHA